MEAPSLECVGEDKEPIMAPGAFGPLPLPVGALPQEIILSDVALFEHVLKCQEDEEVGGGVECISRVVSDLEEVDPVPIKE
jgi:hypothetical protein